jgi:hypothetical protein
MQSQREGREHRNACLRCRPNRGQAHGVFLWAISYAEDINGTEGCHGIS